jgi:PAS domain S-box-containing protein
VATDYGRAAVNAPLHVVLLAGSALTTGGLAGYAWSRRPKPGTTAFAGMLAATTVWTAGYAVALLTEAPTWRLLFEQVQWLGIATVPVWFLLFALAYTGVDDALGQRHVLALFALPAVTLLLAFTEPRHGLLWTDWTFRTVGGVVTAEQTFGPWYWINLAYTYAVIAAGSLLLVRLAALSEYLYRDQSILVGVGVVVPLVANAVSIVGVPLFPGLDLTPYAFTVTGVTFGLALFRGRLLALVPATRQLGRRAAVRDLEDGVIVLDEDRRVVYCNPAAGDVFGVDPGATLGVAVSTLLPRVDLSFDAPDALATVERDGRTYEVRVSAVTDQHGRGIGHTLVVRDVTEQVQREADLRRQRDELERLDRINRVVRTVNRALVGAGSAKAVVSAVPRGLTETGLYPAAAVRDPATGETVVATADDAGGPGAGADDGSALFERLPTTFDRGGEAASAPLADGGVEVETGVDDSLGPWAAVPLVHGRTVYGTLTLVGDRSDAFGPRERTVLGELGETIGYAINAAEKMRLLTSDAVVEVTVTTDDDRAVLGRLAERVDATVRLRGLVPTELTGATGRAGDGVDGDTDAADGTEPDVEDPTAGGDRSDDPSGDEKGEPARSPATAGAADRELLVYLAVPEGSAEAVADAAAEFDPVASARPVGEDRVELELTGGSALFGFVACGANIESLRADPAGGVTLVAEVAPGTDTRTALRRVRADVDVDLRSKEELDRPVDRVDGLGPEALAELTDRQAEALEAAFRAGYFDWPRESTAEEVADAMGVASPTLHGHLRKAERKVFGRIFEDGDGEDGPTARD